MNRCYQTSDFAHTDILAACRTRDSKISRGEIRVSTIEFFVANGGRHMQQADRAVIGKDPR
jgi:hypothetical protein